MSAFRPRKAPHYLTLAAIGFIAATMWLTSGGGSAAPTYTMEAVSRGDIKQRVTADGVLNPVQLINVGTQVSGTVNKVYVDANDEVKEGQVLAEIDPALLKTQLAQSESTLANAQANHRQAEQDLRRMRALYAKDYVARVELERAEQAERSTRNQFDIAKALAQRDRLNLDYSIIKSPVSGVVISREVNEGQTVASSLQTPTLFKIAEDLTHMEIDASVSEADIGQVKPGLAATFSVDAFPGRQFGGVVQKVKLNPNTKESIVTYSVTVRLDNPDKTLIPGMTAYVTIVLSHHSNVLRLPTRALRFRPPPEMPSTGLQRLFGFRRGSPPVPKAPPGERLVYLMRNTGDPEPILVQVGPIDGDYAELLEGPLKEGDRLVTGVVNRRDEGSGS